MTDAPRIIYRGGPRDGEADTLDRLAVTVGDGSEGGVYQRTDEADGRHTVYRWQRLTDAQANAILRGDLRANQE